MSIRTILVTLALCLMAAFTVVNWSLFVLPARLSLIFTQVDAPLGLVLLVFIAVLAALLLSYVLKMQVVALLDARRHAEALRKQRALVDEAEASRITMLQTYIEFELGALRDAQLAGVAQLRTEISSATNMLAACIGEIDERMERQQPTPRALQP